MRAHLLAWPLIAACGGLESASLGHEAGGGVAYDGAPMADGTDSSQDATTSDAPSDPSTDGAPWDPTRHACGFSSGGTRQTPPPPQGPSLTTSCPASAQVVLSNAQIVEQDGGAVTPGSTATLTVSVTTSASPGISYPCVAWAVDTPDVSFGLEGSELYAIGPGSETPFTVPVTFGASIPHGSRVRFEAWAVWSGASSPDGSTLACTSTMTLGWDVVLN
jgi:hypothetical protein